MFKMWYWFREEIKEKEQNKKEKKINSVIKREKNEDMFFKKCKSNWKIWKCNNATARNKVKLQGGKKRNYNFIKLIVTNNYQNSMYLGLVRYKRITLVKRFWNIW